MCKSLSIDDAGVSGVSRDTVFQEILKEGAGFETGDFVKKKVGGGYRGTTLAYRARYGGRWLGWKGGSNTV